VATVGRHAFAGKSVPEFGGLVERASGNFAAVWDIEGHTINCIFVALERMDERACVSIPDFASSIIAACDELIPIFVEAAVGEWKHMTFQLFDQHELLLPFLLYLFD